MTISNSNSYPGLQCHVILVLGTVHLKITVKTLLFLFIQTMVYVTIHSPNLNKSKLMIIYTCQMVYPPW